ncbi:MAG TPA: MXAN_5187 C-terminal domain-containing protein, partial [bacterium]|nr:MXAN_5187 C-terminal domain-containing protein [bacterium]
NSVKLVEEKVKNTTYSLIANSFNIARQLKFEKASKNAPVRIAEIKSLSEYVVVDQSGNFVAGDIKLMSSQKGIPAVERALKEGYASDGSIFVNDTMYLLGVVPVMTEVPGEGQKLFAAVSVKKLTLAFDINDFPMPVKIFMGERFIAETMNSKWSEIENSCGSEKVKNAMEDLIKTQSQKELNRWTYVHSYFMPYDMLGGEKVVFITLISTMPGWEDYSKVVLYSLLYTIAGIIITLFFTFIVTHTIDKVFRNLAADISVMKVGEKLVMKKYSHGADIAVSALNTLISKYLRHFENADSSSGPMGNAGLRKDDAAKKADFEAQVPDPFGVDDIENTPKKPIKALSENRKPAEKSNLKAPPPSHFDSDDNEKTQIMEAGSKDNLITNSIAPDPEPMEPMEQLWMDYCKIKEKNGETVTENEKRSFIGKVRTNRASIMAKYKCSDVQFSIEEKEGKPVIKAKPLNG